MILKSPVDKISHCESIYFSQDARAAWFSILSNINIAADKKVLMPSYIGQNDKEGSGVFDPIRRLKLNYGFYKICEDFSVDISSLLDEIKTGKYSVLLVIHYFGFCTNDMNKLQEICKKHGVILVEDCAHFFSLSLKSKSKVGEFGDYSFFSLHKYLASKSGGVLKINNKDIIKSEDGIKIIDKINIEDLELFAKSNMETIKKIRVKNYNYYLANIKSNENYHVIYDSVSDNIPQTFPLLIKKGLREKLYFYLLNKNIPVVSLYYRMIDEINLEKFSISKKLSSEILNFPVHQDTDQNDIKKLVNAMDDFFEENKA